MPTDSDAGRVHCLRIGKTGSTTLKSLIQASSFRRGLSRKIVLHPHKTTMSEILSESSEDQTAFFLRDPVSRFVSGFNSRLREGAPSNVIPWKPSERIAFDRFPTPNDLAEALSDPDEMRQDQAFTAIDALGHTSVHFTYWLRSVPYLESRMDRIAFIGFQETFDEDVQRFFRVLGVRRRPEAIALHESPPSSVTKLSDTAVANLEAWYAGDREIYDWALEQRQRWAPTATVQETEQAKKAKRARNRARRARLAAQNAAAPSTPSDQAADGIGMANDTSGDSDVREDAQLVQDDQDHAIDWNVRSAGTTRST